MKNHARRKGKLNMSVCMVCGCDSEMKEYIVPEMMYGTKEEFIYLQCPNCECLQIRDIPDDLGKYYQNNYYSFQKVDGSKKNTVDPPEQLRILEVGCGAGRNLCEFAAQGYKCVHGCDPFVEQDITYENGVSIYKKSIHEMEGKYDIILLIDSFEHVTDPHAVFESLYRLLTPRGNIYIDVPIIPNIGFEMFGVYWFQLDAPRHIVLHSRKSMHAIAKVHGFNVINEIWNSNRSQITRSFLYAKGIPFVEQTDEVVHQYFSTEQLAEIEAKAEQMNNEKYGDHVRFILAKQRL